MNVVDQLTEIINDGRYDSPDAVAMRIEEELPSMLPLLALNRDEINALKWAASFADDSKVFSVALETARAKLQRHLTIIEDGS